MYLTRWQTAILDEVRRAGRISVVTLAARLAVSDETIRRHVKALAENGLVHRQHGSVALPDALREPPFRRRMEVEAAAKRLIARRTADLVQDGETVMLDTGSTTAYVAEALAIRSKLTVITNSLEIARFLVGRGDNRVLMAGGELRAHDAAALGAPALEFVRQFRADRAILSVGAFDLRGGLMDHDVDETMFARALIGQAEQVTVVADSTKFGQAALVTICPLKAVHQIVTDRQPPALFESLLAEADVEIIVAADAAESGREHERE
ncbi:MAG: DeoR/GlpR family DNA-binding transcription regulator [Geminicoccaceae bacterium]